MTWRDATTSQELNLALFRIVPSVLAIASLIYQHVLDKWWKRSGKKVIFSGAQTCTLLLLDVYTELVPLGEFMYHYLNRVIHF